MPKKNQPMETPRKQRNYYSVHPWQCRHNKGNSEIQAYVEASGEWETVAIVNPTSGVSTECLANYICNLINKDREHNILLIDAMNTLELFLTEEQRTFTSEQAAESIVARIKNKVG